MTQAEASTYKDNDVIEVTAAAALAAGEVTQLADGRACVYVGANAAASGAKVTQKVSGLVRLKKASGVTFTDGVDVYWDASANTAVNAALTLNGDADFLVGKCVAAAASADTFVLVDLNAESRHDRIRPIVYEFDCDGDNGDTDEHVLIPAEQNPHGLVITHVFALITEVMAGSSEDQGVVTVEDEDDNAICTLTASDSAADVVNDYVLGLQTQSTATGAAAKTVAAGKAVQGFVSQQTSGGTPAGKMKVYVEAIPLV